MVKMGLSILENMAKERALNRVFEASSCLHGPMLLASGGLLPFNGDDYRRKWLLAAMTPSLLRLS